MEWINHTNAGKYVFGRFSPEDFVKKLRREYEAFRDDTKSNLRREDYALNFFLTAWHLIDWVDAAQREHNSDWKNKYKDLKSFQNAVRNKCPYAKEAFTNATMIKHGKMNDERGIQDIELSTHTSATTSSFELMNMATNLSLTGKSYHDGTGVIWASPSVGNGEKHFFYKSLLRLDSGDTISLFKVMTDILAFWENDAIALGWIKSF